MDVITMTDVGLRLGRREVLRDVGLRVGQGESHALVGTNGSGKSVLLRLMCRLLEPSSGKVDIAPQFMPEGRRTPVDFGIVIDGPAVMPYRSGIDNLRYLAGIRDRIGEEEIAQWMVRLGLDPASTQPVRQYSQGMKQRLALAQAMMEGQMVLLLDEPFNALDRDGVREFKDLLSRRLKEGATLVFTSHIDADVSELAARRWVVEGGTVSEFR